MHKPPYKVKRIGPNAIAVDLPFPSRSAEKTEHYFLLRSDVHHDSRHCDRDMEYRHLDEALVRKAMIIDNGDLFDAMGGKFDPRDDKSHVRPQHQGLDYFDAIVKEAAMDYKKYAANWLLFGHGNHETNVLNRRQTDPTRNLVYQMNIENSQRIQFHDYAGWVFFRCHTGDGNRKTFKMYRHHGYGGSSPVTRGVIRTNRMSVYLPDADIVFTGHDHNDWVIPVARLRVTTQGQAFEDECWHVSVPGYKGTSKHGSSGWEAEKGMNPKPKGAAWLKFTTHPKLGYQAEIQRAR